ncbi:PAS domain-containing protein [Methylomonas sp. LL1]|uniref:PAS domain-containing protein n=1 Tax=Methylomonas sp. LL1 TaxID=2785785 RepID=UPI0018C3F993|nr:PAS domain-containing protein [Methylomonas sp. LL1]QPK64855.1 PAS domain-containing protein [Methylomonas sp. LL1]
MNDTRNSRYANPNNAMLIVVIYAVFAALWILLSDTALKALIRDAEQFAVVGMIKGWLFVVVTSLLLYGLLGRFDTRPAKSATGTGLPFSRSRHWLPFVLLSICIVGATIGGVAYRWQQDRRDEFARLQAIAELKTSQISDWLSARQGNAKSIHGNAYFADLFRRWLDSGDTAASAHLQVWISHLVKSMDFSSVILFDRRGHKLWSAPGIDREVPPLQKTAVQIAARDGGIQRIGPYRDSDGHIHLDFVVPIAVGSGAATAVLHTELGGWLYPNLRKWPGPSTSGEVLLFRREGDNVLYLNPLRHHSDSALKLSLPVSNSQLMESRVVRGVTRLGEQLYGVDYRGVASVGVSYAIPGTDWFLIAKSDSTEFFQAAVNESVVIVLISLLVLAVAGTLLVLQQQQAQSALADELHRTEQAVQLQAEVLAKITEGVNVVAGDGRILYVNPAFETTFGYQPGELIGCDVAILNALTSECTPEAAASKIIEQLRTTGNWQGEVLNRRKDGSLFWTYAIVSSHLMPIWGNVWLAVQHDITARKTAEIALNSRNAMLERFNRAAMGRELDMVALKGQINALACELDRDPPHTISALDSMVELSEPWQPENQQQAQLAMLNLLEDAQAARDEAKAIAAALHESEQRLILAQESAHVGIWEWDQRNGSIYWSAEYERLYGVPPGSPRSDEDWRSRVYADDLALIDAVWERHINQGAPFEVEFRIRREDSGEMRWMYAKGSARRDENGKVAILSGINIDITDRKKAEEALVESEQRYRSLTSNLPGTVYRCDVKAPWRVSMLSAGVTLLTGHDATEFLLGDSPLTWADLIVADDLASVERTVDAAINSAQPYRIVYRIRCAKGDIRWVLEHGRAVYDAKNNAAFLDGVIIDITSQKQAEEQLRYRNAELERFNRVTLGREMDIIEMKKRINALSEELGREPPYNLVFLNGNGAGEP